MKALCIRQPYAGLVVAGLKMIENRSWKTDYRGEIAIVASRIRDNNEYFHIPETHYTGMIIGIAELVGIFTGDESGKYRYRFLDPDDRKRVRFPIDMTFCNYWGYAWVLQNPRKIEPIPCKGKLGLFEVDL